MPTDRPDTPADRLSRLERLLDDAEAGRFEMGGRYPFDTGAKKRHVDRIKREIVEMRKAIGDAEGPQRREAPR